tara:strand:- start:1329 stop:2312 length:984 start_codon:yes stop_codon:yes gene_type:complete
MKKKIYTFALILSVTTILLYFVWEKAANIQKQALKEYLNSEWSVILGDETITIDGFPLTFSITVSDFQSPIRNTLLKLQFSKLEIVRLIYDFSDVILFSKNPKVTSLGDPKFNSSSNKLKISISEKPFSGKFKLITEQEDWQISNGRKLQKIYAKKIIFALKDFDETKLEFYLKVNHFESNFLDKILEKNSSVPNEVILRGKILNTFIDKKKSFFKGIEFDWIELEHLDINIGFIKLSCDDKVAIDLFNLSSEDQVDCLLRLTSQDIFKIKSGNKSIQNILDLVNIIFILQNKENISDIKPIPLNFGLNRGLLHINRIPVYQFPTIR